MKKEVSIYKREDLYTYKEAASIIGVAYNSMYVGVSMGVLTPVRMPHELNKFLLKKEVDALAGLGSVTSKHARAMVDKVRIHPPPHSGSLDNLPADEIEFMVRHAMSNDPSGFLSVVAKVLGGKISIQIGA